MKLRQLKPNQAELVLNGVVIFFSYNTPVVAVVNGKAYRTMSHYSVTTSKHINAYLRGWSDVQSVAQDFINGLVEGKPIPTPTLF